MFDSVFTSQISHAVYAQITRQDGVNPSGADIRESVEQTNTQSQMTGGRRRARWETMKYPGLKPAYFCSGLCLQRQTLSYQYVKTSLRL